MTEQDYLTAHFRDLAERSFRNNIYTFSAFLGDAELTALMRLEKELQYAGMKLYGGMEHAQRVMVRFGNPADLGYEEEFPIVCLKIEPLAMKFGEELSHRDYLGALMNLGIERELLGDILIREKTAWLFCTAHIAPFIEEQLARVRHTDIRILQMQETPEELKPDFKDLTVIAASERIDAVIAQVCRLSRSQSQALFHAGKVLVNGRECENSSYICRENDRITVRGFGKFIFDGIEGRTGKGRCRIHIRIYN